MPFGATASEKQKTGNGNAGNWNGDLHKKLHDRDDLEL